VMFFLILLSAVVLGTLWTFIRGKLEQSATTFRGKHVLITGGSKGLGQELARELYLQGAKVSIAARDLEALRSAQLYIVRKVEVKEVLTIQMDVTSEDSVAKGVAAAIKVHGPIDIVIANAGASAPGYFRELPIKTFRSAMDLNYFGTLHLIKAVVPEMIERKNGRIVIVSSGAALCGYVGYSTYCPTKYAIRGLGVTLRNELLPYNIKVHIAYPGNMDTPGFEHENKTKPKETVAIESTETVYKPNVIASCILNSVRKGEFEIACGDLGINLLIRASAAMNPRRNMLADVVLLPLIVFVGKVYSTIWDYRVRQGPGRSSST